METPAGVDSAPAARSSRVSQRQAGGRCAQRGSYRQRQDMRERVDDRVEATAPAVTAAPIASNGHGDLQTVLDRLDDAGAAADRAHATATSSQRRPSPQLPARPPWLPATSSKAALR
jgi:hypothetical protein